MTRATLIVFTLSIALLLCVTADAVIEMPRSVITSGGAQVSDANYRLGCTLGQAAVGRVSGSHAVDLGFWYPTYYYYSGTDGPIDGLPTEFLFTGGQPNPMSTLTTIHFAIPVRSQVLLRLYDVAGREVRTLIDAELEPGYHRTELHTAQLAGGLYFCRMTAQGFTRTKRLVLVR